jgi:hypothetical protein
MAKSPPEKLAAALRANLRRRKGLDDRKTGPSGAPPPREAADPSSGRPVEKSPGN